MKKNENKINKFKVFITNNNIFFKKGKKIIK